jgi:hypothetical protein
MYFTSGSVWPRLTSKLIGATGGGYVCGLGVTTRPQAALALIKIAVEITVRADLIPAPVGDTHLSLPRLKARDSARRVGLKPTKARSAR